MNEPTYRNKAAGEAAEAAVNRLTFNDRLVLWHQLGKRDLEDVKKRGWKQTLIGVGVALAAAVAAAFGLSPAAPAPVEPDEAAAVESSL